MATASGAGFKEQGYDYFLVLDFEATCDNKTKVKPQVSQTEFQVYCQAVLIKNTKVLLHLPHAGVDPPPGPFETNFLF